LLDNAIRHAPENTAVSLEVVRTADQTRIRVSDAGAGIPADQRSRAFERFVQLADEPGNARTNRGLGLAFCKLAVEAQGGTITIENGSPGAVFCVSFAHAD
jgi:K+-sensing histidine kinase KdpD